MARRAMGALLAIIAAVAFVVAIASPAWGAGPPTVNGQTINAKDVQVGLFSARGCNTGGDGSCEALPVAPSLEEVKLAESAALGATAIVCLLLAITAWRIGDRRKRIANVTV